MKDMTHLSAVGRLLGRLLVCEVDQQTAVDLSSPDVADSLRVLGLEVPLVSAEGLDELAAEYFEAIVNPKRHPPLVQSLCEDGRYESAATASVRQIAETVGGELDHELARGAPPDQLGVELLLWSELAQRSPSARDFADRHLVWALRPLDLLATAVGFYGQLASVVSWFIEVITAPEAALGDRHA